MLQLRQGLMKGVFQTKEFSPWAGNKSQSIQVFLCLSNQRDLDHGMRQCLHCRSPGLILTILILTTSRRPLPISFSLFACRWRCPTCGEESCHNGTYYNIICGTLDLATMLGVSRNCLSSTGRAGRKKMSKIPCCPNHIGKHGRSGRVP